MFIWRRWRINSSSKHHHWWNIFPTFRTGTVSKWNNSEVMSNYYVYIYQYNIWILTHGTLQWSLEILIHFFGFSEQPVLHLRICSLPTRFKEPWMISGSSEAEVLSENLHSLVLTFTQCGVLSNIICRKWNRAPGRCLVCCGAQMVSVATKWTRHQIWST